MCKFIAMVLAYASLWERYPDDTCPSGVFNSVVTFLYNTSAPLVIPSVTLTFVVKSYFAPTAFVEYRCVLLMG